jgi:hypothetical protein
MLVTWPALVDEVSRSCLELVAYFTPLRSIYFPEHYFMVSRQSKDIISHDEKQLTELSLGVLEIHRGDNSFRNE